MPKVNRWRRNSVLFLVIFLVVIILSPLWGKMR